MGIRFIAVLFIGLCIHTAAGFTLNPVRTHTLNFPASDVAWDLARDRLYAIDAAGRKVVSIRLGDGVIDQEFLFENRPATLALRPDGRFLYVGLPTRQHDSDWFDPHTGYLGEIDLEQGKKTREWEVDVDPYDILATDDGWLIVSDGSGQWTQVAILKPGGANQSGFWQIRHKSRIALHPSQVQFYSADTDLSPSDIRSWKFDRGTGEITATADSPYHGDFPMDGNVFIHPDGTRLVTAGGGMYTSSSIPDNDMRHLQTLRGGTVRTAFFDTNHKALFTGGASGDIWSSPKQHLNYYGETYELIRQWDLTDEVTHLSGTTNHLYAVSVRPDRTILTVFHNPAIGAETNASPVATFSWTPENPTTRTLITLDAGMSTDDLGATNLVYRWDFEADGRWDIANTNTPTAQVRFNLAGSKTVRLEIMDRYGVVSRVERTLNVPFEEDPGTPGGGNLAFEIPFSPTDFAFDGKRLRLLATDATNKRLAVLNLTNGFIEREFSFNYAPDYLAITPNGDRAYVTLIQRPHSGTWFSAHTGYVAQINLSTLVKENEVRVDMDPMHIVATDDGLLGISGGSDQSSELAIVEAATGRRLSGAGVYMGTLLALHPSQDTIYTGTTGLSPADHARLSFDPTTGVQIAFWDSPYHGDHPISGQPFVTPNGRHVISQGGAVLASSPDRAFDLYYVRTLEGGAFVSLAFDPANKAFFTAGGSWNSSNALRYYNENFELVRSEPLTNDVLRVFANPEKLWLIVREGTNVRVITRVNPAFGAASNQPPAAGFSLLPAVPSTLDYITFDGSLSTDETTATLLYRWDFQADGTYDTAFTNSPTARFRFIAPGTHTVRLQVKDAFGALDEVEHAVTVTSGFDSGSVLTNAHTAFQFPFPVWDAAFDLNRPRAYALDQTENRLVAINLETGRMEREFRFDFPPETVTITPNGEKMYVALLTGPHEYYSGKPHRGYVAEFTLATLGKTREMELPIDPVDIVATDAGHLIISDGSDQWTEIASFDAATGQKLGSYRVYMGMRLALRPEQNFIYGTDTQIFPNNIHHFSLNAAGAFTEAWSSPYHGEHPFGGNVFVFPDGSGVLSPGGVVLSSSPVRDFDLRFLRALPFNQILAAAFDPSRQVMAAVAGNRVNFYNYATNSLIAQRALPMTPVGAFVGMRDGRAAVIANSGASSTLALFRIPATSFEENFPPVVALHSPTNGAVIAVGAAVPVTYSVSDEDGEVVRVEFRGSGFELAGNTGGIVFTNPGPHELSVIAYDNFNAAATSAVVRVVAGHAPTVRIVEPAPDAVFQSPSHVRITVEASDADGSITNVSVFDNGQLIRSFAAPPYSFDLVAAEGGIHNIHVTVHDNLGLSATSAPVRFVVGGYAADNVGPDLIVLTGTNLSLHGWSYAATRQKYEPIHAGNGGGKSVWWAWRAPANGTVTLSTSGSDFDTLLAVYTWTFPDSIQNLSLVASNDDDPSNPPASRVKLNVVQNTVYYIAVDGRDGVGGVARLSLNLFDKPSAPVNDSFYNAASIALDRVIEATNVGATRETFESLHAGYSGGASVWWRFLPTIPGYYEVSTEGSGFDTLLGVYTGTSFPSLLAVASNDDADTDQISSRVVFRVSSLIHHFIAVDGYSGATGAIRLRVRRVPEAEVPLANDLFSNAAIISGSAYVTNQNSLMATSEPFEQAHAGRPSARSLWWSWIAPADGMVHLSTRSSALDTTLAVYTGTTLQNLAVVAANDDDPRGLRTSALSFRAVAGVRYFIAVDSYDGGGGSIVFALNHAPEGAPHITVQTRNGTVQVMVEGGSHPALVERSRDLKKWEAVGTSQPGVALLISMQPDEMADAPILFFRARTAP